MNTDLPLSHQHCRPSKELTAFTAEQSKVYLSRIDPGWQISSSLMQLERTFRFKDYYQTMAFVNAVANIAHEEDHHPDLKVSYNHCKVIYTTHATGGLSENDFICAAKVDQL